MPEITTTKVTMAMMFYVAKAVVKQVINEPLAPDVEERINTIIFNRIIAQAKSALATA